MPVTGGGDGAPLSLERVFNEVGHNFGQADRGFFRVCESGHRLALDEGLTVRGFDVAQNARRVADQRSRLAVGVSRFDQSDRIGVLSEVPKRAVAARIEDDVVIGRRNIRQLYRASKRRCRLGVGFEAVRVVGLEVWLIALWVERRETALWGSQRDIGAGVFEDIIGRRKLLEPKAGFLARISERIVRGKSRSRKSAQDDKWSFCLTVGTLCPLNQERL